MSEHMIALMALGIIGGIGFALALTAIAIKTMTNRHNLSCTKKVQGTIVKHRFPGSGRIVPIVEFNANGKAFLTKKKFEGIKTRIVP